MWEHYDKKNVTQRLAKLGKTTEKKKWNHQSQKLYDALDEDPLEGTQLAKRRLVKTRINDLNSRQN